jgi:hypothetical protein
MKFYKIVNPEGHNDMIYTEGLNTDVLPFNPSGNCETGGIYFSREDILAFVEYGTELYSVEPIGEVYENPGKPKKWKAHSVNLTYVGKVVDNIQFLIDEGADVRAEFYYAILWAAENGHTEVVKVLIDAGADVHAYGDAAIRWAVENGHTDIVKLLIDAGAVIHAYDDYSLQCAAESGYTEVVKLLLDAGADVHANNDYALRLAVREGHIDVVELLQACI